jgi:hypothetical protein
MITLLSLQWATSNSRYVLVAVICGPSAGPSAVVTLGTKCCLNTGARDAAMLQLLPSCTGLLLQLPCCHPLPSLLMLPHCSGCVLENYCWSCPGVAGSPSLRQLRCSGLLLHLSPVLRTTAASVPCAQDYCCICPLCSGLLLHLSPVCNLVCVLTQWLCVCGGGCCGCCSSCTAVTGPPSPLR